MRTRFSLACVLAVVSGTCGPARKPEPPILTTATPAPDAGAGSGSAVAPPVGPTPDDARAFLADVDHELREQWVASSLADWARETDINSTTEAASATATAEAMTALTRLIRESRKFDPIMEQLDPDSRRQFHLLRTSGSPAPEDPAHATELARLTTEMDSLYGKGKACDAHGKCRDIEALMDFMAQSRKPSALLAAWEGWHAVGRTIKPDYVKFVDLANEATRGIGFADVGELWRSRYDMAPDAMVAEADRLWGQVKPLYDQLHCYVRRKLVAKYGTKQVSATGPLPAHLLGNMWAQDWSHIYALVEPFPGEPSPDVTHALIKQKYTPVRMARLAEGFFKSLGLPPLPATFWERSMLAKPAGKEVMCHPSAWDPHYSGDVRIKMCVRVNQEDLITLHHEMGHDYYYLTYDTLPMLYQDGANDGFHEAIGDTIALSITPSYLKQVGLLASVAVSDKAVIDRQMFMALQKIAYLPFAVLIDKWRWEVFAGKVTPAQYNDRWWELRLQYQGVAPPVPRTADDFDPGAKYHVPSNTPYLRYFLATILQFQFHRALCNTAGHTGPLHECSIYGSKDAGARLAATLALGASKPWPDALEALTGSRELDASAILEYFAPLQAWLTRQNEGQSCGW